MLQTTSENKSAKVRLEGESIVYDNVDIRDIELIADTGIVVGKLQDNRVQDRLSRVKKLGASAELEGLEVLWERISTGNREILTEESEILDLVYRFNINSVMEVSPDIQLMNISSSAYDVIYSSITKMQNLWGNPIIRVLDKALMEVSNRYNAMSYANRVKNNLPIKIRRYDVLRMELERLVNDGESDLVMGTTKPEDTKKAVFACVNAILKNIEDNMLGESNKAGDNILARYEYDFAEAVYRLKLVIARAMEKYIDAQCVGMLGDFVILKVNKKTRISEMKANVKLCGIELEHTVGVRVM